MSMDALLGPAAALLLSPLLLGLIHRVKALFGGRTGRPLLQTYFDLAKLLAKGAVFSRTATWVFRAGPSAGLAASLLALCLLPFAGRPALLAFPGDAFLFAYLLGLARFFTMTAALDTGSSFEGMGASREAAFSAMAEPWLLLTLLVFMRHSGSPSLSVMFARHWDLGWSLAIPVLALASIALFILLLSENCRIPVDDPNTHLELTMIHEVMVLDHGGPDLGLITWAQGLRLWAWATLLTSALGLPGLFPAGGLAAAAAHLAAILALAATVGVIESIMARLRLIHVPRLLAAAGALSTLALVVSWR